MIIVYDVITLLVHDKIIINLKKHFFISDVIVLLKVVGSL